MSVEQRAQQFRAGFQGLRDEIGKIIVGQKDVVDCVLTCLFCGGHVLLEGVPGIGKTMLVRTLSQALQLKFSRIQFTPDLMPADIIGTNLIVETASGDRCFKFQSGPIFAQMVLADEINRATPKTQSALLEAMQEHTVTVGGQRHLMEEPFIVIATENPIEMEGTYPLPEAQLDRFLFKVMVGSVSREELGEVLDRTTAGAVAPPKPVMDGAAIEAAKALVREVVVAPHVKDYAVRVVLATRPDGEFGTDSVKKFVRFGSSPRGAQALMLAGKVKALLDGRFNLAFDDIASVAFTALRHRMILNFEGEAEGVQTDTLVKEILEKTPKEAVANSLAPK
jgi:MoxR-like ATPase